jgi:hypothetical protein
VKEEKIRWVGNVAHTGGGKHPIHMLLKISMFEKLCDRIKLIFMDRLII